MTPRGDLTNLPFDGTIQLSASQTDQSDRQEGLSDGVCDGSGSYHNITEGATVTATVIKTGHTYTDTLLSGYLNDDGTCTWGFHFTLQSLDDLDFTLSIYDHHLADTHTKGGNGDDIWIVGLRDADPVRHPAARPVLRDQR